MQFKDRTATCKKIQKTDNNGNPTSESFYAVITDEGVTEAGTALNAATFTGLQTEINASIQTVDGRVTSVTNDVSTMKPQLNTLTTTVGTNKTQTDSAIAALSSQLENITGEKGDAATIQVGTVSSGAAASVTNVGTSSEAVFNFVLPKGDPAASIHVGSVQTLPAGQDASVTVGGTATDVELNFALPRGATGDAGSTTLLSADGASQIGACKINQLGDSAAAGSFDSIAIGKNAKASARGAVAIANRPDFSIAEKVVINSYLEPYDLTSDDIGSASGKGAIAIGNLVASYASQDYAVGSIAKGENSVAVKGAVAGKNSIAIGGLNSGDESVSLGSEAVTAAQNSTAVGSKSHAEGQNSAAFGRQAQATQNGALALGANTVASGNQSFVAGYNTKATGDNSIAIGSNNLNDTGSGSILIGSNAKAVESVTIAIGNESNAVGFSSVAIGPNANTMSQECVSLGSYAKTGAYSVAVGEHSLGTYFGTALGSHAVASGDSSVAIGKLAFVDAPSLNSVAIGSESSSSVRFGTAIGPSSKTTGDSAVALGVGASASGQNGIALGSYANNSGTNALALGVGSVANGESCIALGGGTVSGSHDPYQVPQARCIAIGKNAEARVSLGLGGMDNIAIGASSCAYSASTYSPATGAVAVGANSSAQGNQSAAFGYSATALYGNDTALGNNAKTTQANMVCLGSTSVSHLKCAAPLSVVSDRRDKADVEAIASALPFVKALKPVTYVRNQREKYAVDSDAKYLSVKPYDSAAHASGSHKGTRRISGLIAQDVYQTLCDVYGSDNYANIVNIDTHDAEEEFKDCESQYSVCYEAIIPFLIKAVQEQQAEIEQLKAAVGSLQN